MSARDRAGHDDPAATTGHGRDRRAVVRCDERRGAIEIADVADLTGERPDRVGLEGLLPAERRQHGDEPLGEHRLADAGRPGQEQVVAPGGGELEREPRLGLADDVGEVGPGPGHVGRRRGHRSGGQRHALLGRGVPVDDVAQRARPVHRDAVDELGLGDVLERHHDVPDPSSRGLEHRGQHAPHAPDPPVEGQLAEVDHPGRKATPAHDPRCGQHRHGDRQVEARPALRDRGRREVDRDAVRRHRHPAGRGGRADPVGRLRAGGVGQPTDGEVRQPRRDVGLDVDERPVEAAQGDRQGAPEPERHDPSPTTCRTTAGSPGRHSTPTTSMRTRPAAGRCARR